MSEGSSSKMSSNQNGEMGSVRSMEEAADPRVWRGKAAQIHTDTPELLEDEESDETFSNIRFFSSFHASFLRCNILWTILKYFKHLFNLWGGLVFKTDAWRRLEIYLLEI